MKAVRPDKWLPAESRLRRRELPVSKDSGLTRRRAFRNQRPDLIAPIAEFALRTDDLDTVVPAQAKFGIVGERGLEETRAGSRAIKAANKEQGDKRRSKPTKATVRSSKRA